MCGIAGLLGIDVNLSRAAGERMRAALAHRGPDDSGLEVVKNTASSAPTVLVHTRLSIVDLSADGHQPMWDRPRTGDAANVVTFNGEIYNFRELNAELARAGWPARTGSDTETLLHAYRVWGVRAVERLEGMFAFCLLDAERRRAWLCRDRLGIKPIYLFRPRRGGLLFASEVRALLAAGPELVPRTLRRSALESFLAQGAVMSDASVVEGVTLLEPGQSLVTDLDGRELERQRYWAVAFGSELGADVRAADGTPATTGGGEAPLARSFRSELVFDLRRSLRRSVSQLLLADVPVGLFLSSGIDSSALATVASELSGRPLHTLAVGFDVAAMDETADAARSARDLGTHHERIALSAETVLNDFDDVLAAADQPTVDGFNTYYVSLAARRANLTVALSGVGGDELFGGYRSFTDVPRALRLRRALDALGPRTAPAAGSLLERALSLRGRDPRARAWLKAAETLQRPADLVELYLLRRELFAPGERRALHALPPESDALSGLEHDVVSALRRSHAGRHPLDRIAALELSVYMRHMLLRDADVFGMANRLEIRVPLLEHYLVADAARARAAWRRADPRPKPLLVDAAGERLPERSWRNKKRGFTFPWRAWLEGPLAQRAEAGLRADTFRDAGLEPQAVTRIWQAFRAGDRRVSELEVIALVALESYVRNNRLTA